MPRFSFSFLGWVLWSTDDVDHCGGWCELFVSAGWGSLFFFRCFLSPRYIIVPFAALYFFDCWVWFFGLKGSLYFLFCRCWLLSPLPHFPGCVFSFLVRKDLWFLVVFLDLISLLFVEVFWCLERVVLIPHFLLSLLICIRVASIPSKCFTFFFSYYLCYSNN